MTGPATGQAGALRTWRDSPPPAKALVVGLFVNRLGGFLLVFLVLYLIDRGLTATQAGTALGVHGAGSIVGVLAGGALADRLGARRAIVGSMAASAVLMVALLQTRPYPAVLAVAFAVGATSQVYRPAAATVLSRLTPPDRQVMIFATYRLALNLGTTVAPLLGAALVAVSYSALFYVEAAAMLGYAAIVAVALPADAPPEARAAGPAPAGRGYAAALADRRYLIFLAATFLNALIYVQYLAILPLSVRADGLAVAVYGSLVALNGLLVITCELPLTTVTQRWAARTAAMVGLALTGVGLSLYGPAWGVLGLVAATMLWTFGEIVSGPTMSAYPATAGPPALRGRYIGASQAVFGLGFALGPIVGVAAWNRFGDVVWWACGAISLLAVLAAASGMGPAGESGRRSTPSSTPRRRRWTGTRS
jgi:MFS family permease